MAVSGRASASASHIPSPKVHCTCSSIFFPLFLLLITPLPLATSSTSTAPLDTSLINQASILVTLKQSLLTAGNTTTSIAILDTWDVSNHHHLCSAWPGIRCDSNDRLVLSLDLSNANLSGTVPPAIGQLTALTYLSLAGNALSGDLPQELFALPNIKYLNLSNNRFNGTALSRWDLSGMVALQVFDVYNNDFSGPLPPSVVALPSLLHLELGGNYFSGSIPASYGEFKQLEYLSLAGNDLSGRIPAELGNLTALKQLYLGYYNVFDGGIPLELGKLSALTHLDLSSCGLQGEIPPELGMLGNLDTLFLMTNQLTGPIPSELANLTALKALDMSNNALTGGIPPEFSQLCGLTLLHLFMNRLTREIPAFVAEFPELQVLKLWRNNFTGAIPERLGSNGKLRELDLSTNKLTGVIPDPLCSGRRLEIIILLNNFLFGPIPDDLGRCTTLTRVRVGQNYLSGAIPPGFLYLPELLLIELQNNYLTGKLSEAPDGESSTSRSKLGQLNLSNNRIFGRIPASIGELPALQILLLDGNQFTDPIPPELGKLTRALKIDISGNNLTGSIPPELGGCALLTYLDISQNQLSGPVPVEISQIRILNYLNLSNNNLDQGIPREIGGMKSLTSADFSRNNFTGCIPETGQFAYLNASAFAGNPGLRGYPLTDFPCSNAAGGGNLSSFSASSSGEQVGDGERGRGFGNGGIPGKFKLVLALALLACSLVFAATVVAKTRSSISVSGIMGKKKLSPGGGSIDSFEKGLGRRREWRMTTFQKVDFTSRDIVECIKECNVIGRGGAGIVYRATTPSGETVAVKRLFGSGSGLNGSAGAAAGSMHEDGGFNAEVQTLGKIRHRNIVRLVAFLSDGGGGGSSTGITRLLVYEHMPNGSLGEALHGKRGADEEQLVLSWDARVRIACEAARGLCYLHHDCRPPILHRDVKSNNILLSAKLEAHVADFGLAKFLRGGDAGASECMSAIAGSYGYIAPEYAYTLKVDEKSDVYSFGVVLLELLTGRRPVGDFGEDGLDIVQWVKATTGWTKDRVANVLDKKVPGGVPMEEAMHLFFVAMLCVQEQSVQRPTMREVVQMLGQVKQHDAFNPLHAR